MRRANLIPPTSPAFLLGCYTFSALTTAVLKERGRNIPRMYNFGRTERSTGSEKERVREKRSEGERRPAGCNIRNEESAAGNEGNGSSDRPPEDGGTG